MATMAVDIPATAARFRIAISRIIPVPLSLP